jgi:transposase-like protein
LGESEYRNGVHLEMKVDTYMKERIAEKIDGLIVGRKRDGRSICSSAGKRGLFHACLQPGISVAGSPLANGINANFLRKWIQRYHGRQSNRKPAAKSSHRPILHTSLDLLRAGYNVYVVVDASSTNSKLAEDAAILRLVQAGAVAVSWLNALTEFGSDFAGPHGKGMMQIVQMHWPASTTGQVDDTTPDGRGMQLAN